MNHINLISSLNSTLSLPQVEEKDLELWFPSIPFEFTLVDSTVDSTVDHRPSEPLISSSTSSNTKVKLSSQERKKRNSESSARHRAKKKVADLELQEKYLESCKEIDKLVNENLELKREVAYLKRLFKESF
jgi:hypothetical protein